MNSDLFINTAPEINSKKPYQSPEIIQLNSPYSEGKMASFPSESGSMIGPS
jgi:hypothetical protein